MGDEKRSAPSFQVTCGGSTFTQPEANGLETLTIEDHVDMVEQLTMRITGTEQTPKWSIKVGDAVDAKVGAGNVLAFKGEVISVEPSWSAEGILTLMVRAYDNTHRLGRGRKTRWFEKKKDSEIAETVGKESELEVECDPTEETRDYVLQRNESNLTFLKRLAARNNFQLAVDEGKLIFKKASLANTPTDIEMGKNLRSLKMSFNTMEQVGEVVARGWDIREKKEIVGKATPSDIDKIGGGDVGAELSTTKFGSHTAYITDVPFTNQSQANELAKAEMNRSARQFGKGSCTVEGNDALRAGQQVNFKGLNQPHNGTYFIVSSKHIVGSTTGYITEFQFCSNTSGT